MNYAPKSYYKEAAGASVVVTDGPMRLDERNGEITFINNGNNPLAVRAWITRLKDKLLSMPGEKADMPVTHEFIDGMCIRRLYIKKGTLLVGKIHKQACINFVERGDISVLTETGASRVAAGFSVVSPIGIQKVGFAHEDTIFTNVFRTDETDPEKIEDVVACESYDALGVSDESAALIIEGDTKCQ